MTNHGKCFSRKHFSKIHPRLKSRGPLLQRFIENLTKSQFLAILEEMIKSGDFLRHVCVDLNSQQVTYIPYRETERLKSKIIELEKEIEELKNEK